MEKISVKWKRLHPRAVLPSYQSAGAAGCDAVACLDAPLVVKVGERVAAPTGFAVEIPEGYEIQVRPRSGLAFKKGLTVINAPGTIDSDYRGEVKILLVNLGDDDICVEPGERVAQLLIQRVVQIDWQESETLGDTARSTGGFGSTGSR